MKTKVFIYLSTVFGVLFALNASSQIARQDHSSVYVYFEEKMRAESEVSTYKLDFGTFDLYVFEVWEPRKRTLYNTVDKHKCRLVDSDFVQKLLVQPSEWLIDMNNFDPDKDLIRSKKYDRIYILEKVGENSYKIIEIVCYIGDVFFAPERRKNQE